MILATFLRRARGSARPMLWIYLLLIGVAEYVTAAVHPTVGLALHAIVLGALVFHAAFAREPAVQPLMGALTLAPLIRLLSLSLPLGDMRQVYWYPVIATPLLLATFLLIWQSRMPRAMLGLKRGNLALQMMVMTGGVGLGALEYFILQPAALVQPFTWAQVVLAAVILLIFTGFTEELIFRGVLQSLAIPVLGRWSLLYMALLFAALHIGYLSLPDAVFVFVAGLLFGYIAYWSGSLLGVTLAHGLTNIFLFLVMPYAAADVSAQLTQALPWLIAVTSTLSIGAIVVLARQAGAAGRLHVGEPVAEPAAPAVTPEPAPVPQPVAPVNQPFGEGALALFQRLSGDNAAPLLQVRVEDAALGVRALLFVPARRLAAGARVESFAGGERTPHIDARLLPPQYAFVAGVVEIDALPRGARNTAARELAMLRVNRLLSRTVRRELDELANRRPEAFEAFWHEHGGFFGIGPWSPQLQLSSATSALPTGA